MYLCIVTYIKLLPYSCREESVTLHTQNTKATGYFGQLKPNPLGVVQLFALLLVEQIVRDACT